jgi:hypothetical protein
MSDGAVLLIVISVFLVFFVLAMTWHFRRSASMIGRWAAENGYRLLGREYRWFRRGPFWWRTTDKMAVYHVTVEDREGRVRRAWVRCGGWFLGLFSDQVTVEWED